MTLIERRRTDFNSHIRDIEKLTIKLNGYAIMEDRTNILKIEELERKLSEKENELKNKKEDLISEIENNKKIVDFIYEMNTDGWWDWNLITQEEYFSDGFRKLLGYTKEEFPDLASSWQSKIFPEDKKKAFEAYDEHVKNGKPFNLPVRYRHKDGSTVWVICRGQVLKDKDGKPYRMIGTHTDITHIKGD